MTGDTVKPTQPAQPWADEDEIDLRQYLDVLIRWWREIVAIILAFVVLALLALLLYRLLAKPQYEARADIAIVRTVSEVKFDERFRTTSDELTANGTNNVDARRSALLGMVVASAIAQEVIAEIGNTLTDEEKNTTDLMKMVRAELSSASGSRIGNSDLIRIVVTADSPEKATTIANAWAQIYVRQANTVYGQVPSEVIASIEAELVEAQKSYAAAQAALEIFISTSQLDTLKSTVTVLQQRVDQEVLLQQAYLKQWQATLEQLSAARALLMQVEQGGDGAARSTMAALQVLKMSAYGMPSEKLQLEVRDLPQVTQQAMVVDLTSLLTSLEARRQDLENQIALHEIRPSQQVITATTETSNHVTPALSQVYLELQNSKAQLEAENAHYLQLTQRRDLYWETFKTVSSKVAELNLSRAAASSEVRLAALAVPATEPVPGPRLGVVLGLASVLGLILAVLVALLAQYLGRAPFFLKLSNVSPQP